MHDVALIGGVFHVDPVRILRAVLLEISNDNAMTTGTDGTKLCLSYTAALK